MEAAWAHIGAFCMLPRGGQEMKYATPKQLAAEVLLLALPVLLAVLLLLVVLLLLLPAV